MFTHPTILFLHHSIICTHLPVPESLGKLVESDMLDIAFCSDEYERIDSVLDGFVLLVSQECHVMNNLNYCAKR